MAKKNSDKYYFDVLAECANYGCKAAEILKGYLLNFDVNKLSETMASMHEIEHQADMKKHEMLEKLAREFMTPIEREDILELAQQLDTVVDCIDDVMQRIYMHNILVMRDEVKDLAELIVRATKVLHSAAMELEHFQKSQKIRTAIVEINSLESDGDALYIKAMRQLYTTESNPIQVISWTHMYEGLEYCLDACEHACDTIESVIMKNS